MVTTGNASDPRAAPEELLALALSRPTEALRQARTLADETTDPVALSYARQAAGIVLRDAGDVPAALTELRAALADARRSGDAERIADVRATTGAALVMAGRTRTGLAQLAAAAEGSSGAVRARVLLRRGYLLLTLGRHAEALAETRRALAGFRAAGDEIWQARALNNRAAIHLAVGSLAQAEHDVAAAERLFTRTGQQLEAATTTHNRGEIAYCRGDLPGALARYDEAAHRYDALAVSPPELALDRCTALLAAGLAGDAVAVLDATLTDTALSPTARAELVVTGAMAALAADRPDDAAARAREARRLFRRQEREWWWLHADLVLLRARWANGERGRRLADEAAGLGRRLAALRSEDAPVALLLAGQLAAASGSPDAGALLAEAGRYRTRPSALVRASAWLALATDRDRRGDARGVLRACSAGLAALDDHRATLGSSELRALASRHGDDLAALALRHAVTGGSRRLLAWGERWRAAALTQPPVRPPSEARLAERLGELRSRTRMVADDAPGRGGAGAALEAEIRRELHRAPGGRAHGVAPPFDASALVAAVEDDVFVELLDVDGRLHVLTVTGGRVRRHAAGTLDEATQALVAARFLLRQLARGRPADLTGTGRRLQEALLGPSAAAVVAEAGPSARVVVSPPPALQATPWGLLPALADRPVSTVPSAAMWLRAREVRPRAPGRTVLAAGPGLLTGGAEVDALAAAYPDAVLLRDGAATVPATLAALDGARLAHIAAHGTFRADSPMFSSLELDDGPLTVHDLELLREAPYRLVLSACDSGVMAPVGAHALLGLVASLLSMGTAGVVASVAVVNDEATVDLMLGLHRGLAAGGDPAEVLLAARERAGGDVLRAATAASFAALGV
ncbi:CHAT domain-containing protein [Nocardioides sp. GY 10113]|uniref:CHAT domain-containing protein n=1 Tax=Nocardioides sp. GY 10113 TaxID=2569761 RepID=UPI0010A806BB|nr:CHAT domain-containing protein [Nocardioides sp. GY 10113]TIC87548.1 CHAT domain-containing protein [Nocardioides sp. GY 10113]